MTELARCPWGHEVIIEKDCLGYWHIRCYECGQFPFTDRSKKRVIAAWNKRSVMSMEQVEKNVYESLKFIGWVDHVAVSISRTITDRLMPLIGSVKCEK